MLTLHPIGYVRTGRHVRFDTLHQPEEGSGERHVLELEPGARMESALHDLSGFSRIWLVWWFHKNAGWRARVMPPRGPAVRRGVLATRSPHRPNPLGITPVRLLEIQGTRLLLGPCDLMDGTPVFDIKPYIPAYDSFPEESSGWIGEMERGLAEAREWGVEWSPLARTQTEWLAREWRVDFRPRLEDLLGRDPTPHRARRIRRRLDGSMIIGCGGWQAVFALRGGEEDRIVWIERVEPGFPEERLRLPGFEIIPDYAAQLAFLEHWPAA